MGFKKFYINENTTLNEGGAFGHLSNVYDMNNYTFADLKTIISDSLQGKLEQAEEKTDGQNITVTWKDGQILAARNKGHLKNFGANAMTTGEVRTKFAGRGPIETSFTEAMVDLGKAIGALTDKQKDKIFKNGKKFMSVEVIYPDTENVVPYGYSELTFHQTLEYDIDGNVIDGSRDDGKLLQKMMSQVSSDKQKTFNIRSLRPAELPVAKDFKKSISKYNSMLSKIQKSGFVKDNDTIQDYHDNKFSKIIMDTLQKNQESTDEGVFTKMVHRWSRFDKSFSVGIIKKTLADAPKTLKWYLDYDKKNVQKQWKQHNLPLEGLFQALGNEVIGGMTSFMAANPDTALVKMKDRIKETIEKVAKSGDQKLIDKLELELGRLEAAGGMDAILPTEGITFMRDGHLLKLTGTFASVNQILGLLHFM